MGRRPCEQSNIPKVDNSAGVCDEIIPAGCVIVKNRYHNIGNGSNENLEQIIGHINDRFEQIERGSRVLNKRVRDKTPNDALKAELRRLLNEGNNTALVRRIVEEIFR